MIEFVFSGMYTLSAHTDDDFYVCLFKKCLDEFDKSLTFQSFEVESLSYIQENKPILTKLNRVESKTKKLEPANRLNCG